MKIMRGRVRKVLVLFIVGFLIMQVLFNDASTRVKAAHSEMGTIVHINGVRLVREANTNVLSTCFCIAREKICSNDDNVLSDIRVAKEISENQQDATNGVCDNIEKIARISNELVSYSKS